MALGGMGRREVGLARELAAGVERNRGFLDFLLSGLARRELPRDPLILCALRLGAYQIVFLSRIPSRAAVHETVALVPRMKPLVNALLRRLAGQVKDRCPDPRLPRREVSLDEGRALVLVGDGLPEPNGDWVGHLAMRHSLPPFLVSRWREHLGEERAAKVCIAASCRPALHLRVNRRMGSRSELQELLASEGVQTEVVEHPSMLRWKAGPPPFGGRAFAEGWFVAQDPTAVRAVEAVQAESGETIIDLCAAPGTKATYLAEAVAPDGKVLAYDPVPSRRQRIQENADRLGLAGLLQVVEDPDALYPAPRVLVDVPCSNTGVLARRVEVRRRIEPTIFAELAATQGELIRRGMDLVLPGGRLVYSSCSLEPEENGSVVQGALGPGWQLLQEELTLPDPPRWDGGYFAVLSRS